jgi:hypothetical protein
VWVLPSPPAMQQHTRPKSTEARVVYCGHSSSPFVSPVRRSPFLSPR